MPGKITAGQKCRLLVTVPSPPASGKTNCKAIGTREGQGHQLEVLQIKPRCIRKQDGARLLGS